jgi:hypothetical protein
MRGDAIDVCVLVLSHVFYLFPLLGHLPRICPPEPEKAVEIIREIPDSNFGLDAGRLSSLARGS